MIGRLRPKILFVALPLAVLLSVSQKASALTCVPGPYIVFFDSEEAYLDEEARFILDHAIDLVGECGQSRPLLVGHSDTKERSAVSLKRAATVRAYLEAHGVPRADIKVKAVGATQLRVKTAPNVSELQNRRVEITYGPGQ